MNAEPTPSLFIGLLDMGAVMKGDKPNPPTRNPSAIPLFSWNIPDMNFIGAPYTVPTPHPAKIPLKTRTRVKDCTSHANIHTNPPMAPPASIIILGFSLSINFLRSSMYIVKRTRKTRYGIPLSVDPIPSFCSSGVRKMLHEYTVPRHMYIIIPVITWSHLRQGRFFILVLHGYQVKIFINRVVFHEAFDDFPAQGMKFGGVEFLQRLVEECLIYPGTFVIGFSPMPS